MNILNKTYFYLFLFAFIILFFFYRKPNETFDINIQDTYYVIQNSHFGILLFILYVVLGLAHLYLLNNRLVMSHWILNSHVIISILGLVLTCYILGKLNNHSTKTLEEILRSIKTNRYLTYAFFLTVGITIATQLVFGIFFLIKIFRK